MGRYLAYDAAGNPCYRAATSPSWLPSTPIGCKPYPEYQRNHPPYLRVASPDYLLRMPSGGVLKYNRTPFCVDLLRDELLCHQSLDSLFCAPETYWQQTLTAIRIDQTVELRGRCLLLDARFGKEFYHFYASVLGRAARFLSFDHYLDQIDYFILPEASSFVVRWAEHLGIPPERRFYLSEKQLVRSDELILPSNNYELDYRTIAFIRNRIVPCASCNSDKIFISRSRSVNGRHVINEAEVFDRVLAPRGFRVLRLEDFSLHDQATIMRSARVIIAPHGGGLTNLLFCNPGTRVLELFGKEWVFFCYARMCSMLGIDSFYHVAPDTRGMDIHLDVDKFAGIVDQFLENEPGMHSSQC